MELKRYTGSIKSIDNVLLLKLDEKDINISFVILLYNLNIFFVHKKYFII